MFDSTVHTPLTQIEVDWMAEMIPTNRFVFMIKIQNGTQALNKLAEILEMIESPDINNHIGGFYEIAHLGVGHLKYEEILNFKFRLYLNIRNGLELDFSGLINVIQTLLESEKN
jgi:hypothetical protein